MSERSPLQDTSAARLLAKKSSYQAWKCVSFACSLLALLLLLSKWHEISSDLQFLLNIEQLVGAAPTSAAVAANSNNETTDSTATTSGGLDFTMMGELPAMMMSSQQPPTNETWDQRSNHSLVVSHMQISVSRELQGNQMLKREVETFIGELVELVFE